MYEYSNSHSNAEEKEYLEKLKEQRAKALKNSVAAQLALGFRF
jgi:hypothetical protein